MIKRIFLLITAMVSALDSNAQQDSQFSQYIFNGLHINPAYAGYKEDIYIQSMYRSQWEGIKGAPKTFSLSADGAVNDGRVGLGLIIQNDQIGAQSALTAYANYAYKLQLGNDDNSKLSFGLAAGFMQLGIDGNKLDGVTPDDGAIPVSSQTTLLPDARLGVYYSNDDYFAGFSATNLLAQYAVKRNNNNILVPQPHFYLTAGAQFPVSDDLRLKPIVLLKDDVKGPTSLDLNAFLLIKERVWLGAFYRTSVTLYNKSNLQNNLPKESAMGLILELFATPNLRIGYSYDYSLNGLRNYNYGSHEISVGFYISRPNLRRDRGLKCYDF
jgi:type IX secretion system PorP/SprF family membrane protein